jgi:hypothetical protein
VAGQRLAWRVVGVMRGLDTGRDSVEKEASENRHDRRHQEEEGNQKCEASAHLQ